MSTINITGGPIIFNSAPSWQLKNLLSTSWHQPASKTAESIMFLNILSGFHFVEKVISNFIRKFCSVFGEKDIKTQRVRLSYIRRSKKIIHRPDLENVLGETSEAKTCLGLESSNIIFLIRYKFLIFNPCLSFVFWESKYDEKFAFVAMFE